MEKEMVEIFNRAKENVYPQLQDDLIMFIRENDYEVAKSALFVLSQLNSGVNVHDVFLDDYCMFSFEEQDKICDSVLNFARYGGTKFVRTYHPVYMQLYQQASQNAKILTEVAFIEKNIAAIEDRNEIFQDELYDELSREGKL